MNKFARVPANERTLQAGAAPGERPAKPQTRYFAFLSYSHRDEELADWLQRQLEQFRVPSSLAGRLTDNGVVPRRLAPIFRDEHDLAAADDLGEEIEAALASSRFLIVLCSPDAARSRWTNAEIELFKRSRPDACVLAAIASGEPFASELPGREAEECFPPALRQKYDRRGRPTGKRAEPLAADFREDREGRRHAFLKLVAGMLGVPLDELVQRETTRRHRRMAWLAAASLGGMAVTSTLAVTAIHSRNEAREQRREAEGLVAFMLGDLKDKLEPIGRLDALDGVGARVLAYYSKQDASELSDAALIQRARALSLMGEVANLRGDFLGAERLYREAAQGTAEAVSRNPGDPERLYAHAQNVFYEGYLAAQRGDYASAEKAYREYRALGERMVAIDPDNLKWRVEVQDAEANLGVVLLKQRRFAEASAQFAGALRTIDAVAAIDPRSRDYQLSLADSLAWLADAELAEGRLTNAVEHRRRLVALLEALERQSNGDVEIRQKLVPAHRSLGRLLAAQGQDADALHHLRQAVAIVDELIPTEAANTRWLDYGAIAHLTLAQYYGTRGQLGPAQQEARAGCALAQRLPASGSTAAAWQDDRHACLAVSARIALAAGDAAAAERLAREAVAIASKLHGGDRVWDGYVAAGSNRLLGDALMKRGQGAEARQAWSTGLRAIQAGAPERPWEADERGQLLLRTGDSAGAATVEKRLRASGFRNVEVLKI